MMRPKSEGGGCALLIFLPEVVTFYEHLKRVRPRVDLKGFEDNVCAYCAHCPSESTCWLREKIDRDLESYLQENCPVEALLTA